MSKLRQSSIADYLRSPRLFYWKHVRHLVPLEGKSVKRYEHDMDFGTVWARVVDRFYQYWAMTPNLARAAQEWNTFASEITGMTDRIKKPYDEALKGLALYYYENFSPDDGVRALGSELKLENELFEGTLDGLGTGRIIHECKATSRSFSVPDQVWTYRNSLQCKLYSVLARAEGIRIELAFKDPPHEVLRAAVRPVSEDERDRWTKEFLELARTIDATTEFVCHPRSCSLLTKRGASVCPYKLLCDNECAETLAFYKEIK